MYTLCINTSCSSQFFHSSCFCSDLSFPLLLQVPTSQKKEGVYDVPKSQPVSVSISLIYVQ